MKKIIALVIAVGLVVAFTGCSLETGGQPEAPLVLEIGENVHAQNKLTVSATGSVDVMPDVAYVTVGVTTQHKDMKQAQDENKTLMNAMFDALKSKGLTEDDMKTTNYSAYPRYDYKDGVGEIELYEVTNMVQLSIMDIDNVGEYIDVAADSGANTAYPINFSLRDEDAYYNDALAVAVREAKGKADTIAEAGDYNIISTLEITEGSYGYAPYREYAVMDEAEMDGGAITPITAGELEVTANITVVYEIQ